MQPLRLIVLLALLAPPALAQPFDSLALAQGRQPSGTPGTLGTRTLRGVVVTNSDVPLARVRVAVTMQRPGTAGDPRTGVAVAVDFLTESPVLTDDRGQFTVRVPDADSVRLTFTKARYATANVVVTRGELSQQNAIDMRVRLALGGAISGQVRNQYGAPVMQMAVTARRLDSQPPSDPPAPTATTNDLGEFRFGGLAAGAYAVGIRPGLTGAGTEIKPPDDQTVNVSFGAEVTGIDLSINEPSELPRLITERKPADPAVTGSIRGRVATARGAPIAGAVVQAYGPEGFMPAVESDALGRYVFDRLPPGDYRVLAFKRGYITPGPEQAQNATERLLTTNTSGRDRIVPVRRGQTVDSVDLILGRGASIAGTIVDEFGEPMQGVAVNALELRAMGGRTRALRASSQGTSGRTDDRGRYRLFGLQPGTYVVQAVAGDVLSATIGYVPLFYPGTPAIDSATPTKLDIDAAAAGIDLTLLTQPTRRVRGTLFDPAGKPIAVTMTLTASSQGGIQTEPERSSSNVDGTFVFNNIAPGNYIVQAAAYGSAVPAANVPMSQQFTEALVTVAGDEPAPLQLKLSRGATLMGRVVYEGIAESFPPYAGLQLTALPAALDRDPLLTSGTTGFALLSDNTFEYRGVFGRSVLSVRPRGATWYVKSITHRGRDLADSAFDFGYTETFRDIEIVISGAGAVVAGRATDDRAAPVRDYSVALFPADRSKWTARSRWLKVGRSSQDGAFRLTGVVPGDYWAVAVDRLDGSEVAGDLQNPEVLDALASRAVRITLGEGQLQNLTLRLVRR
jgi:carboxypeptidase family protein